MKKIFLLDNKDSFTYNLVHYLEGMDLEVVVRRNDEPVTSWPQEFDGLVLSPGPGLPQESGTLMKAISKYWGKVPILGVCLGHQAIAAFAGGNLIPLKKVYHGVVQHIEVSQPKPLYEDIPPSFDAGLYHSWAVNPTNLPSELIVNSTCNGIVMGLQHQNLPIYGVQFHPESVMTANGLSILKNWVQFSIESLSLTKKEHDIINNG